MLQTFGHFIMKSRRQAMLMALIFATLPLMGWLAVVIVGLVTLRHGAREGFWVMVFALIPNVVWFFLGLKELLLYDIFAGSIFVWVMAQVLSRYNTWAWVLQITVLLGVLLVLGIHAYANDIVGYWVQYYHQYIQTLEQSTQPQAVLQMAQTLKAGDGLDALAKMTTGLLITSGFLLGTVHLMMARFWQAALYKPGGFKREFLQLRLGYTAAIVAVLFLLTAVLGMSLSWDLLPVVLLPFIIAGFSLVHGIVAQRQAQARFLLIGFYGVLVFFYPYSLFILMLAALIDCFVDFRQQLS